MYIIPQKLYLLKILLVDGWWKWVSMKYNSPALWPYQMSLLYDRNSAFCHEGVSEIFQNYIGNVPHIYILSPTPVFTENAFRGWILEMSEHEISYPSILTLPNVSTIWEKFSFKIKDISEIFQNYIDNVPYICIWSPTSLFIESAFCGWIVKMSEHDIW